MKRRQFLEAAAALGAASLVGCQDSRLARSKAVVDAPMDRSAFHASRRFAKTSFGDIACFERGAGAAALFLHGFPLNSFQWRGVIDRLAPVRRCIAPDFMGLGYTRVAPGQGVAPADQVRMLPQWSRGGRHLYHYRSAPTPAFRLVAANGGAPTTLVPGWDWGAESGARVSPDGRTVVYTRVDRGRSVATMLRDLRSGGESPLSEVIDRPQWSPDGRWLAGTRAERRNWLPGEVVMCAVHASSPCTVVARGARLPQWSDDGTQLHYVRPVDDGFEVYATTLADRSERRLAVLAPQARTGEFYDVGPDGRIVWVRYERGRRELWKMELPR